MFGVILFSVTILLLTYYALLRRKRIENVPGPDPLPFISNFLELDLTKPHISMDEMAKKYGPVFQLHFEGSPSLIVCDYHTIHQVLVSKSADFAGRPVSYLTDVRTEGQSGIVRSDAGPHVQGRRKLMHYYLKQYGTGMKKIEDVTMEATEDMLKSLAASKGHPVDIRASIFHCISDIIGIMLTGDTFGEEMNAEIQRVVIDGAILTRRSITVDLINRFPFLRHFSNSYRSLIKGIAITKAFLGKWFDSKPAVGFINFIQELSENEKRKYQIPEFKHQRRVVQDFYFAGILTTSRSLTTLMLILSRQPQIQKKLRKETRDVIGDARVPSLADRENMPYHMATILELSRYASILSLGLNHKTVRNTSLKTQDGKTIPIPAGTEVITHLWSMHHSTEYWTDPFLFDPERFLDADGQLVSADHPNRKHVMAFGAGHRVCVGEVFALSRMFLILSRVIQTFHILPESTVDQQPSADPRNMKYGTILSPPDFKVRLQMVQ